MARNSKVDQLKDVQLFSSCTVKELTLIARAADEVTVSEGSDIVTEGSRGHEFYLILDGRTEVSRNGQRVAVGAENSSGSLTGGFPRAARMV
jgi:hypothetical protein